ncbi:hypothetical protein AB4Z22_24855, partial [Paenibacillus sp. TAF58]
MTNCKLEYIETFFVVYLEKIRRNDGNCSLKVLIDHDDEFSGVVPNQLDPFESTVDLIYSMPYNLHSIN